MNYAIIAAGEGSRLVQEGVSKPKPLVEIDGEPMIQRLINIFLRCRAESVSVIVNEQMTEVREFLEHMELPVPLNIVVKSTPSSMHSFAELTRVIPPGKFILTTVDTIFDEHDFDMYVRHWEGTSDRSGLWAVTTYIDDEKPLYVDVDSTGRVVAFRDGPSDHDLYVSAGIYGMTERFFPIVRECVERGESRMRNFQRAALNAPLMRLGAHEMLKKVIDVDHASDIAKAEELLYNAKLDN